MIKQQKLHQGEILPSFSVTQLLQSNIKCMQLQHPVLGWSTILAHQCMKAPVPSYALYMKVQAPWYTWGMKAPSYTLSKCLGTLSITRCQCQVAHCVYQSKLTFYLFLIYYQLLLKIKILWGGLSCIHVSKSIKKMLIML